MASGSVAAMSAWRRSRVRGDRSSWETLATNCRCESQERSRRPRSSSKVSPSSLSSSSGPRRSSRSWRLLAEIRRAVAVMVRTGRSIRPAKNHPSRSAMTVMMARAIAELMRSWWRSDDRLSSSPRALGPIDTTFGARVVGGRRGQCVPDGFPVDPYRSAPIAHPCRPLEEHVSDDEERCPGERKRALRRPR